MSTYYLLKRTAGLGDVLMLLPLARALAARDGAKVVIATDRKIAHALAGPAIEGLAAIIDAETLDAFAEARRADGCEVEVHDMSHPRHSIQRAHQVDSFLAAFGIDPALADRSIRLPAPESAAAMVDYFLDEVPAREETRGRVLVHPASGALHRTWPKAKWQALVDRLLAEGVQVFLIGSRATAAGKGAFPLALDDRFDLVDKFKFWETLELMRRSDCLVTTDTAPIQMAGATRVAIAGIYSITRGEWRLPARDHGTSIAIEPRCRFFPCYPLMYEPEHFERARAHFQAIGLAEQTMLYEWCCDDFSYACMESDISVDEVLAAVLSTLPRQAPP